MKKAEPFYHSTEWKRARAARLLIDNYICTECISEFEAGGAAPRRASMVHHVIPITERPDLALEIENLRSLCDVCHNRLHPEKGGQGKASSTERRPRNMRIIKI